MRSANRKAMAYLVLLVSSEVWNERNSHVFKTSMLLPFVMLDKIKKDSRLLVIVGAKRLSEIIPKDRAFCNNNFYSVFFL